MVLPHSSTQKHLFTLGGQFAAARGGQYDRLLHPTSADFTITTKQPIKYVTLYSADGRKLLEVKSNSTLGNEFPVNRVDLNNFIGIILIKVECLNGQVLTGRQILY